MMWHRSAGARIVSRFCSTKRMVVRCVSRLSRSTRQINCTIEGWMPSDGSSKDQPWLPHQRPPNRQLLLLAARHRAGQLLPALLQDREILVDDLQPGPCPIPSNQRADRQILLHRHAWKDLPALRDVADAAH